MWKLGQSPSASSSYRYRMVSFYIGAERFDHRELERVAIRVLAVFVRRVDRYTIDRFIGLYLKSLDDQQSSRCVGPPVDRPTHVYSRPIWRSELLLFQPVCMLLSLRLTNERDVRLTSEPRALIPGKTRFIPRVLSITPIVRRHLRLDVGERRRRYGSARPHQRHPQHRLIHALTVEPRRVPTYDPTRR